MAVITGRNRGPGTKEAYAEVARRRWPVNTVKSAMVEWGLTDGEAKGLVYGHASQSTIDKILEHPRGGFGVGLEALEIKSALKFEEFLSQEIEAAEAHKLRCATEEAHWSRLGRLLSDARSEERR